MAPRRASISSTPSSGSPWTRRPVATGSSARTELYNFDAPFHGSAASKRLTKPVVGMATDGTVGYWLVDAGGHVYPFGAAKIYGNGKV